MSPFLQSWGSVLGIAVMGLTTYLLRIGGFWFMGRVRLGPRVRQGLDALPGSIFVATALPLAIQGGPAAQVAAAVSALVMLVTRQEVLAILAALAAGAGMRAFGF